MSGGFDISVTGPNVSKLQNRLRKMRGKAPIEAAHTTKVAGDMFLQLVRSNASGRPGPNIVTGAYRHSIQITAEDLSGNSPTVTVGTSAPQAQRLEFGFVGVDSLGRHYAQPPLPHWRPAIAQLQAYMPSLLKALAKGTIS